MKKTAKAYQIIDSDTHITEPADVWTSRVAAKYNCAELYDVPLS